jgi:phosphatidate cytidylyltransferase
VTKKLLARLAIFFIGIPAVIAIIVFLPQYNHLAFNVVIIAISAIGAIEFALMLKQKGFPVYLSEAAILGALSPASMTLAVSFQISSQITPGFFILGAAWLLVSGSVLQKNGDFSQVLHRLAAGFSVILYPGHFLSWLIRMNLFRHSNFVLLIFILTVMANDSFAWFAGLLFGKNNRGLLKVSPNKSIAGFIAGLLASVTVCIYAAGRLSEVFDPDQIHWLPSAVFLGLFSGLAVILGDLAESAIKRSCGVKDSGNLIPGRGGILDSIDSIAFTAPVFFILYRFFF